MKRATVVIGANYGDEGKGVIVDYLASKLATGKVVVRFNGGAQAGHTVVTPEGKRHVFSHFGAGTLTGAATYLAKHFVCNPLLFWKEAKQLEGHGASTVIAADPRCYVTTPYDMLINQAVEEARGAKRHGSVGVGFGETIERNRYPAFQLWKDDLKDHDKLTEKLRLIRDKWLPTRCAQLGIPTIQKADYRLTDELLDKTIAACAAFESVVGTAGAEFIERKEIIFEGAQGLCLDMDSKNFPHVTRSNTGLKNVVPLARALGLSLDVIYVTRAYLTKHGAGPLPNEHTPDPPVIDETNTEHPYQGVFRFAPLDVAELKERVAADLALLPGASHSIALTCTDQVAEAVAARVSAEIGNVGLSSKGPRRDAVALH
jgi:adenylosuccinate synthase